MQEHQGIFGSGLPILHRDKPAVADSSGARVLWSVPAFGSADACHMTVDVYKADATDAVPAFTTHDRE
jgi:hypothetical protein